MYSPKFSTVWGISVLVGGFWRPWVALALEPIDHIHMEIPASYIILQGSAMVNIRFHDQGHNPVSYTGQVTVDVSHPKGYHRWTREDPYWDGSEVEKMQNTYQRGAAVCGEQGWDDHITINVQAKTSVSCGFAIFSLGTTTVTATADGKSDSDTCTEQWIQGRATWYNDDASGRPSGPYLCAIPWASQAANLLGQDVRIHNPSNGNEITADVSWPGPLVPKTPHYPPSSQDWNHYWGAGGWPPLAVALDGKTRARQDPNGNDYGDVTFARQIIDIDDYNEDNDGHSAKDKLGMGTEATLRWRF